MDKIEKIRQEIESRIRDCDANSKNPNQLLWAELSALLPFIDSLQQEQESVAEQFAKIIRANLSEIGNNAQSQFEQLYFEITGTKMYGGYND